MRAQPVSSRGMTGTLHSIDEATSRKPGESLIPGIALDGTLFPIEKMQAHRQSVLHLAVSVFVMCGDTILLQRRALSKYHCGGLWANTCCSHPHWGEPPANGARRRLREELGLVMPLRACNVIEYAADVTNGLREHERVHVFCGEVDSPPPIRRNPNEVLDTRWMDIEQMQRDVRLHPEIYAPWFRIYVARWGELGLAA
jgi:isopentenyl-diphosphate delta-isomerase